MIDPTSFPSFKFFDLKLRKEVGVAWFVGDFSHAIAFDQLPLISWFSQQYPEGQRPVCWFSGKKCPNWAAVGGSEFWMFHHSVPLRHLLSPNIHQSTRSYIERKIPGRDCENVCCQSQSNCCKVSSCQALRLWCNHLVSYASVTVLHFLLCSAGRNKEVQSMCLFEAQNGRPKSESESK